MRLFPERDDRRGRRLLLAALILSLCAHLAAGGGWGWVARIFAPAVARALPTPTPEIVALSDAITIEKRTVPREAHRAPRRQQRVQQRPRALVQLPALQSLPVPTLPPVPTQPPTVRPTTRPTSEPATAPAYRSVQGTLHRPRAEPTPEPTVPPTIPPKTKSAFSPQQMAALDAQFSRTIAQAQSALSEVPRQRRPPARSPDQLRYEAVMAGTPEQFLAAFQGDCVKLQGPMVRGQVRAYYIRCFIRYNDGYFENVSFPWPYRFLADHDPFDDRQNPNGDMRFGTQPPTAGFVLQPNFALSRAVCTFFRAECESIIARERVNGNQPAGAP